MAKLAYTASKRPSDSTHSGHFSPRHDHTKTSSPDFSFSSSTNMEGHCRSASFISRAPSVPDLVLVVLEPTFLLVIIQKLTTVMSSLIKPHSFHRINLVVILLKHSSNLPSPFHSLCLSSGPHPCLRTEVLVFTLSSPLTPSATTRIT